MATMDEMIEGLLIPRKYCTKDTQECCAEHDIFYAGPFGNDGMGKDDLKRLKKCGWFIDEETGSWAKFT